MPAKSKAKAKAAKAPAENGRKGGKAKKSKAAVESEDDSGEEAEAEADGEEGSEEGEPLASKRPKVDSACPYSRSLDSRMYVADEKATAALESDPEALKVREWRHKLQKMFLSSNKSLPKEDETPAAHLLFTTVEGYQNMNIDYLTILPFLCASFPSSGSFPKSARSCAISTSWRRTRSCGMTNSSSGTALDKWHQGTRGDGATVEADDEGATVNGAAEGHLAVKDIAMDES
ncbi:hypothetical protein B0H11DRAFT_2257312 [Mycena galericulata]|nr:hypothetical protein B0H11DRAFT_2257312 [Mycena galericulata]